jgi:hypothetical protein
MLCTTQTAFAGKADVVQAKVDCNQNRCDFQVTVKHQDTGWKHYANKWDIMTADGQLLATRTLYHPHEHEQPFTRSLNNVEIPKKVHSVVIRAHDLVHGYGGKEIKLSLPGR